MTPPVIIPEANIGVYPEFAGNFDSPPEVIVELMHLIYNKRKKSQHI